MDAHDHRALRRQLGAMARPTLELTRQLLAAKPELVAALDRVLSSPVIPELSGTSPHEGAFHAVKLEPAELDAIVTALVALETDRLRAQPDEGNLSFAPTIVDVWSQLRQTLRLRRPSS